MKNIDKLNSLLADTQTLTNLLAERKNTNEYTISFFSQAFETAHHLLLELHALEAEQMELFSKQLEAHQSILSSLTTNTQQEELPKELITLQEETLPIDIAVEQQQEIVLESTETVEITEVIAVTETVDIPEPVKAVEPAFANYIHNFVDSFVEKPVNKPIEKDTTETIEITIDKVVENPVDNSVDKVVYKSTRSDFKRAFTLNDLFLFRRELFKGDDALMHKTIDHLNQIETLNESLTYLQCEFSFDLESQTVKSFVSLLEKRFA